MLQGLHSQLRLSLESLGPTDGLGGWVDDGSEAARQATRRKLKVRLVSGRKV